MTNLEETNCPYQMVKTKIVCLFTKPNAALVIKRSFFLVFQIMPSGDLYIHDLSFEDMGMFRCLVSNEFGHDMKETFVYPLAVS